MKLINLYICKLNYFGVLCNIHFKEHLPEDGHNAWPKHVAGCAVYNIINLHICICTGWGHAVAHLVETLRYKPEGRGFDSRWCHWNFSVTYSFRPLYVPAVDSASNRNEYQEYFLGGEGGRGGRCVGLTTLLPSCADCLEIWEPQPPGTLRVCQDL